MYPTLSINGIHNFSNVIGGGGGTCGGSGGINRNTIIIIPLQNYHNHMWPLLVCSEIYPL